MEQEIEGHGRDQRVVVLVGAVCVTQRLLLDVYLDDITPVGDVLGEALGKPPIDLPGAPEGGKDKRVVGSPRDVIFLEDEASESPLVVEDAHPLACLLYTSPSPRDG